MENNLTPKEFELLRVIAQYFKTNNSMPSTQGLAQQFVVSPSAISNFKTSLKRKGYLTGSSVTDLAWQLLDSQNIVFSTQIPIFGQVKAGRTKPDEVAVIMVNDSEPFDIDSPTIKIPNVDELSDVFALEVVGQSMERERIYEGDFVIVQKFKEAETPRDGELIVTKYLKLDAEGLNIEQLVSDGTISDDDLEGPTVKYYYKRDEFYRLGWRKDFNASEYTIKASYVDPIGRVVGVYQQRN